jgi:hypothetical protein
LDGFTPRERELVANIARYHRKALPADRHADYMALDEDDRTLVRRLAALLWLADGLDADHFLVVEAATVATVCASSAEPATCPTWTCGRQNATATCSSWSSAAGSSRSRSKSPSFPLASSERQITTRIDPTTHFSRAAPEQLRSASAATPARPGR